MVEINISYIIFIKSHGLSEWMGGKIERLKQLSENRGRRTYLKILCG